MEPEIQIETIDKTKFENLNSSDSIIILPSDDCH